MTTGGRNDDDDHVDVELGQVDGRHGEYGSVGDGLEIDHAHADGHRIADDDADQDRNDGHEAAKDDGPEGDDQEGDHGDDDGVEVHRRHPCLA